MFIHHMKYMTTITIKEDIPFDSTEFDSVEDLLMALYRLRNMTSEIDFHELSHGEISPELYEKILSSKKKDISSFSSLSSE